MSELRVFGCSSCGAPLPAAADGQEVVCIFCSLSTRVEYSGAAMLREQASRREAESLYKTLGQPPSWSQRVAVVLTNGWLWLLGLPFMFALLVRVAQVPRNAIYAAWESHYHERLQHVMTPIVGWLFDVGWPAGILIFLLIWSLFGERIDARRDLQAALASKPPKTIGGPSLCRNCDAPLEVAPGALGARCSFCGADNLVQVPASWIASAAHIDAHLRLSTKVAQERAKEGARRVRRAALWRLPFVVGVLALVMLPALRFIGRATWQSMRYDPQHRVGVYKLATWHEHDVPTPSLRTYASCDDARMRKALLPQATLASGDSQMCELGSCTAVAVFSLAQGERLRLVWTVPGAAQVLVALGDRDYGGGVAILYDGFGDKLATPALADGTLEAPIAISGYYKIQLRAAPGTAVEPCVIPAGR